MDFQKQNYAIVQYALIQTTCILTLTSPAQLSNRQGAPLAEEKGVALSVQSRCLSYLNLPHLCQRRIHPGLDFGEAIVALRMIADSFRLLLDGFSPCYLQYNSLYIVTIALKKPLEQLISPTYSDSQRFC